MKLLRSSPTELAFTFYVRTGRGENEREHPATHWKRVRDERGRVIWAWLELRLRGQLTIPPGPPWDVRLVRLSPSSRLLDDDNLVTGFKGIRDQVAIQLGLVKTDKRGRQIALDGDRSKIRFTCEQEPKSEGWGARVEIRSRLPVEAIANE